MMKIILIILVGLFILLFLVIHFIVPYKFIHPVQKAAPSFSPQPGITYEKVIVNIDPNNFIAGFHVHPTIQSSRNDTVIIILHGISGAKEKFLSISNYIAKAGYRSFVFDLRKHGESTGEHFTYGHEEKEDVSKMIDLIESLDPSYTIGILGHSMGGAIAAQALAHDSRLSFGIIQSSFRHFSEIVHDYNDRITNGIAPKFLVDYILKRAGKMAGFDPFDISPLASIQKVGVPIMVSHGDKDDRIKYEYGQELYASISSPHKKFYPIIGGQHDGVLAVGGTEYFEEVVQWISSLTTH